MDPRAMQKFWLSFHWGESAAKPSPGNGVVFLCYIFTIFGTTYNAKCDPRKPTTREETQAKLYHSFMNCCGAPRPTDRMVRYAAMVMGGYLDGKMALRIGDASVCERCCGIPDAHMVEVSSCQLEVLEDKLTQAWQLVIAHNVESIKMTKEWVWDFFETLQTTEGNYEGIISDMHMRDYKCDVCLQYTPGETELKPCKFCGIPLFCSRQCRTFLRETHEKTCYWLTSPKSDAYRRVWLIHVRDKGAVAGAGGGGGGEEKMAERTH